MLAGMLAMGREAGEQEGPWEAQLTETLGSLCVVISGMLIKVVPRQTVTQRGSPFLSDMQNC